MSDDQNTDREFYGKGKKYPSGHPFYQSDRGEKPYLYFRRELISKNKRNSHVFSDFDEFFEIAPIGFATITKSCLIKEVNEAFLIMTERDEDEIINKDFTEYVKHYDKNKFLKFLENIKNNNGKEYCDVDMLKNENSILHSRLHGKCNSEIDDLICLVVNDISDHVNNEIRLHNLLRQLSKANEIINNQNYELRELNTKLTLNKSKLNKIINEKDDFMKSISSDLTAVFGRFLILADYIQEQKFEIKDPDIVDLTRDLYSSVKSTIKLLEEYNRL